MEGGASGAIPDVAVSDTAHLSAILGFGTLAVLLCGAFFLLERYRKKCERDGIYRKYRLPEDPPRARR